MALGNQKLEPIKHEKARLATFKKRKASLVKKANEFTTLCDVDACMIIYGPKHKDQPVKPETWASEEGKLTTIINKYKKSTGGKVDHQPRKGEDRKSKVKDEVVKVRKSNRKAEYATWDHRLDSFSEDQLRKILGRIDSKLEATGKKLEMMKADQNVMEKATTSGDSRVSHNLSNQNVMEKATTSGDSRVSHNLSNQNVDSRQQSEKKRKSLDDQQAGNFRANNQFCEMPATPMWMRLNRNNRYQSSGASTSTIPFTPLQGPAHWTPQPSCDTQIRKPLPLSMRGSVSSEKNAARLNEFRDFLQLKPPGD